jgi:hypothetical protein
LIIYRKISPPYEQQTWNLRENTEAMQQELEAQIAVVEVQTGYVGGSESGPKSLQ